MKAGRIVLLGFGVLLLLGAVALVLGGGAMVVLDTWFTDERGYLMTPEYTIDRPDHAVLSETARLEPDAVWQRWLRSTVRVLVTPLPSDEAIFLGIAPAESVEAYLADVAHHVVDDLSIRPTRIGFRSVPGTDEPEPPTDQRFWTAAVAGSGEQSLQWDVSPGRWVLVLMNADGSEHVQASIELGLWLPWLGRVGIGLLIGGALVLLLGTACVVFAVRSKAPSSSETAHEPSEGYPLSFSGELTEPLSPALWLVKWFLLIPHYIVLAFLWAGLCVSWLITVPAVLLTGRYPRALFDYNVGVLRWSWRVGFYGYQSLSTDRYPPFSLRSGGYPADLDVVYPTHLSRGMVLVKWWLLALPQLVLIGLFQGGGGQHWGGGLVPLLTLYAGVALLFTGRYPHELFRFIMGMNRWTFRVLVYVALMTDHYPPFRLEE